jgi:hypothetical protein
MSNMDPPTECFGYRCNPPIRYKILPVEIATGVTTSAGTKRNHDHHPGGINEATYKPGNVWRELSAD